MVTSAEMLPILQAARTNFIAIVRNDYGIKFGLEKPLALQVMDISKALQAKHDEEMEWEELLTKVRQELLTNHPEQESAIDWAMESLQTDIRAAMTPIS